MRILELCLSPDLGGLELYMQRCCQALSQSDEVTAVVSPVSKLQSRLQNSSIELLQLNKCNKGLPLLAARRLAQLIDVRDIEIVHVHWGKDIALAALAKLLSKRKPRLVSTRQMKMTRFKRDPYHALLYSQIDLNLTITKQLAKEMRQFLPAKYSDRVTPLYYGVAAPEYRISTGERHAIRQSMGIDDSTFLVGLFGRIKHFKGQHLLVDAMGKAISDGTDVAGLIVGHAMEDDYLNALKHKVEANAWTERILFRDFVNNPQQLMQVCDAVVLTTIEETFGLVLVEAMRAGITVVGSDSGGVPEIIDNGKTGLLFRSGNADDLYNQLKRLWQDEKFNSVLARQGKMRADQLFDEGAHYRSLRRIFAKCMHAE